MFKSMINYFLPSRLYIPYWPNYFWPLEQVNNTQDFEELQSQLEEERKASEGFQKLINFVGAALAGPMTVGILDYATSKNDSLEENNYKGVIIGTILGLGVFLSIIYYYFIFKYCKKEGKLPDHSFIPVILMTSIVCVLKALTLGFSVVEAKNLQAQLAPIGEICKEIIKKYGCTMVALEGVAGVLLKIFNLSWHKLSGERIGGERLTSHSGTQTFNTQHGPCAPIVLKNLNLSDIFQKACKYMAEDLAPLMVSGFLSTLLPVFLNTFNWTSLLDDLIISFGQNFFRASIFSGATFVGYVLSLIGTLYTVRGFKILIAKLSNACMPSNNQLVDEYNSIWDIGMHLRPCCERRS